MDIRLHYKEAGQGFPLILLHGNGEDLTYFRRQIPVFAQIAHVFAPDTRGHGQTPRGKAPFTLAQFADDLGAFMDEQGIEKADLLGFSDGGNIALLFALKYPQRVRSLIICGANLHPAGLDASFRLACGISYRVLSLLEKAKPARQAPEKTRIKAGQKASRRELLGLMLKEPHIDPAALSQLHMPVLVMAGTHDMIKRRHTELIASSIPGARLALIRGGHSLAAGRPEEFNRRVLRFLTTCLADA